MLYLFALAFLVIGPIVGLLWWTRPQKTGKKPMTNPYIAKPQPLSSTERPIKNSSLSLDGDRVRPSGGTINR